MTLYSDRIKPTDYHIRTYLDDLRRKQYQIPTFQREVVWERDSVKKLWDSIYRFYPIGSILIWITDLKLQNHRTIGGHVIADENSRDKFNYILDGQQRTTSLLTSLYGGTIEGKPGFDPTLYFDLTVEDNGEVDEQSYKQRFLFWDEIDDREGSFNRNIPRMAKFTQGLIIRLKDVMTSFGSIEEKLAEGDFPKYDHPIRKRLRDIRDVLDNYRLSSIELKGINVSEVCQIFERINQEGKPLDIFDIVVAKTFRVATDTHPGFYFRELIDKFREETPGNYTGIDDLTYLQVLAVIINRNIPDSGITNVTPTFLNRIKTEQIEAVWYGTTIALKKLFDFFDNYLHLKGPRLIPNRYFYLTLASHFYENRNPNYEFLKKYFWYYSLHNDDLLTSTTHIWEQAELLSQARNAGNPSMNRFFIDRDRLRNSFYSTRGRVSTAILAFLANHEPRDWADPDRAVLTDVYYTLTDKPNLHHIFPSGYIDKHPGTNRLSSNCMMNIAYLTQLTNIRISDKNPLEYLQDFDSPGFETSLKSHLAPIEMLEWSREESMPDNALDIVIEKRINLFIESLGKKLSGLNFDVVDTKEA